MADIDAFAESNIATASLETWKETHALLLRACKVAQEAVAAKRAQQRFLLEEICANLTDDGKLRIGTSVWKRPVSVKKLAVKRVSNKAAVNTSSNAKKRVSKDKKIKKTKTTSSNKTPSTTHSGAASTGKEKVVKKSSNKKSKEDKPQKRVVKRKPVVKKKEEEVEVDDDESPVAEVVPIAELPNPDDEDDVDSFGDVNEGDDDNNNVYLQNEDENIALDRDLDDDDEDIDDNDLGDEDDYDINNDDIEDSQSTDNRISYPSYSAGSHHQIMHYPTDYSVRPQDHNHWNAQQAQNMHMMAAGYSPVGYVGNNHNANSSTSMLAQLHHAMAATPSQQMHHPTFAYGGEYVSPIDYSADPSMSMHRHVSHIPPHHLQQSQHHLSHHQQQQQHHHPHHGHHGSHHPMYSAAAGMRTYSSIQDAVVESNESEEEDPF